MPLEGSFRAELVGSVPSKAMYDRLVAEDSSKAVSAPMQITWMCYATFSNLGIQVLRIQRQLKAMCFRKVMTVADSQQKCQVFCRETQRCLDVGIRPAQPREASSWYVSAFLPCIGNPEWTMQITWMYYATFSSLGNQILRIQRQGRLAFCQGRPVVIRSIRVLHEFHGFLSQLLSAFLAYANVR